MPTFAKCYDAKVHRFTVFTVLNKCANMSVILRMGLFCTEYILTWHGKGKGTGVINNIIQVSQ